ncbi:unnamed protein product [Aphanomyces euteiches]|nr:hypothetical protein Ae201684P_014220 [Aphanomyces euteiches]KAH9154604.1 hypothetical protein AeRB84_003322 [Aphanomyces euteiches]
MATNSRTSCLHSNMPTEKIIGIFEHLKHRRAALEAKRAEIMADYVDEAKETTQKKRKADTMWANEPKTRKSSGEFSKLFTNNIVPPPMVM